MKTILIIDDDELCRRAAAEMLRASEWNVLEAVDGEQGIEMAKKHRPDVVLSDLLMPRGNGFTVLRALRAEAELEHTRFVVMSGRDYPTDRRSAEEAGAQQYLLKPLSMATLNQALADLHPNGQAKAADGNHAAAPAPAYRGDDTVLRFWGVRGSIPSPGPSTVRYGGNTSCVELRADGEIIVMDAGTGIRPLGLALSQEFKEQPLNLTLLISHTHWDHIQGFPFFRPAYEKKNILRILGYEGARASLAGTLAGQMESPYFPIPLKQMPSNLQIEELRDMDFQVGQIRVQSSFSKHPGVCVGFRLFTSGGSIVYLPDNEWAADESVAMQDGEPCNIEKVLLEFIRDADVVIIDSQYDQDEYLSHKGWGHGCVDDVVRLAIAGSVKQLFLFHHDPEHDDAFIERMVEHGRELARAAGSPILVEAAREGAQVVLPRRQA